MSLRCIAALAAEPELGRHLVEIRRLIGRAQDSTDAGRYRASRELVAQALALAEEREHREHELVRALLPKIYGLQGFNAHKLGDPAEARRLTTLALDASKTMEDVDGIRIYGANLEHLAQQA